MICSKCGANVKEGIVFCPNCGNKITVNLNNKDTKVTYVKDTLKWFIILPIIGGILCIILIILGFILKFNFMIPFVIVTILITVIFIVLIVRNSSARDGKDIKYYLTIRSHFTDDNLLLQKLYEKLQAMGYYRTNEYSGNTFTTNVDGLFDNVEDYINVNVQNGNIYIAAWCKRFNQEIAPHYGIYVAQHKRIFMKEIEELKNYFEF